MSTPKPSTGAGLALAGLALAAIAHAGLGGCGEETKVVHHCYYDNIQPDAGPPPPDAAHEYRRVTMLHTTDIHEHASGYSCYGDYTPLDSTDNDRVKGGYARIAGIINQVRQEQEANGIPVLVFDSGDFTMGTVYTMTIDDPLTFKFLEKMRYDAVAIGNHEFDFMPLGLAMMVNNALASPEGFNVPLLASNMVTDPEDDSDDDVEALVAAGIITDRLVLDLPNGLRVGVLGIIGEDADGAAPLAPPVTFDHTAGHLQALVDDLKDERGAHIVALLSHSGIHPDGSGDDFLLALEVDRIDVILSGHYHELTPQPDTVTGSIIYIAGEYGHWVSRLDARVDITAGEITDFDFQLIPVDDSIPGDASIQAMVDAFDATLTSLLVPAIGWALADPMVEVPFDMEVIPYEESGLCNLCADSLRTVASLLAQAAGDPTPNFDVAIFPSEAARDGLYQCDCGYNTMADVFNVIPLGISPDPANQNNLGWPMVTIYLTPAEIKLAAEMSVSVSRRFQMDSVFLCFSGVRAEYDPRRPAMPPDRVTGLWLCRNGTPVIYGGDGDIFSADCTTELDINDNTTLLKVVTDFYSAILVTAVQDVGLSIYPKFSDGTPINVDDIDELLTARIDVLPGPPVEEWKPWMALAGFVTFPGILSDDNNNGMMEIPPAYDATGVAMGRFIDITQ